MDEWLKFVRELGFPAAVATFVLWRLEARLVQLTTAIVELRIALYRTGALRDPRHPEDHGGDR